MRFELHIPPGNCKVLRVSHDSEVKSKFMNGQVFIAVILRLGLSCHADVGVGVQFAPEFLVWHDLFSGQCTVCVDASDVRVARQMCAVSRF